MLQGVEDTPGQGANIVGIHGDARLGVLDDFFQSTYLRNDNRGPGSHSLQGHNTERLVQTGKDGTIGHLEKAVPFLIGDETSEENLVGYPQFPGPVLQLSQHVAGADYDELGMRIGL